jgi:hypothetical protein
MKYVTKEEARVAELTAAVADHARLKAYLGTVHCDCILQREMVQKDIDRLRGRINRLTPEKSDSDIVTH